MTIDFSAIIKTRRKELGLTQAELADRAMVNRLTVWGYENNKYRMTLDILMTILDALGLKLDVIEQEGATE